jgi:hypothetical protein
MAMGRDPLALSLSKSKAVSKLPAKFNMAGALILLPRAFYLTFAK